MCLHLDRNDQDMRGQETRAGEYHEGCVLILINQREPLGSASSFYQDWQSQFNNTFHVHSARGQGLPFLRIWHKIVTFGSRDSS